MADVSDEIDDFAIFKARSLGAESEYLVLAKAGQLRGREPRTPDTDDTDQSPNKRGYLSGSRRQRAGEPGGSRCESPCSLREGSCSPKIRRNNVPYTRSDSTKTETLETRNELFPLDEEGHLHRAHSYRSRRSPQPHAGSQLLGGPDQVESKLNRSRTMTMPARRRPVPGKATKADGGPAAAAAAGGLLASSRRSASRTSFHGCQDTEVPGSPLPVDVMDRAVLRVRNFSTKSGSVVNRGDSIKVRGGRSEYRAGTGRSGSARGSRPPSLKDENGGVVHSDCSPLGSPSNARPSLSRHSSRGSYKHHPETDDGWGATRGDALPCSTPSAAHNLLSPYTVTEGGNSGGYTEDDGGNTHLRVSGVRRGRSVPRPDPGTDEEMEVYKVLVLGSQGVGKTTLAKQLLTSEYLANNETDIDDEASDRIVSVQVDDEESLLQFMDAAAAASGPGSQANKDRDLADANLVVYSVTDRVSFTYAQTCLQELRPAKRHNVVILVGNKQDIVRNRVISEEDGKCLAAKRHCKFIEVSALLNHKTDDLLVGITRQIRLRKARNSAAGGGGPGGPGGGSPSSPDRDGPVGCLQRIAMEAFRKIFKRRAIEATSCDDLFTP